MSPKSDDLVPWQQWILSRTQVFLSSKTYSPEPLFMQTNTPAHFQVVGIPHWNDNSLKAVIDQTNFSEEVRKYSQTLTDQLLPRLNTF